jgi:hypothetical protein
MLWSVDGLRGAAPGILPAMVEALTGTGLDPTGAALGLDLDGWRQRKAAEILRKLGK